MKDEMTDKGLILIDPECLKQLLADIVEEAITRHFDKSKEEKLLTISQAAAMLETDRSTLWHWDKEGYLKKIRIGGKPRYKKSDIDRILNQ